MNSKKTVLLAGYAQMIATDLAGCIENEGYEFLHEDNISEVCSIITSRSPHLVILEISLTDRTGFDLCQKIREWGNILAYISENHGYVRVSDTFRVCRHRTRLYQA
jgi:DNA-binding response OmpR family regulator